VNTAELGQNEKSLEKGLSECPSFKLCTPFFASAK